MKTLVTRWLAVVVPLMTAAAALDAQESPGTVGQVIVVDPLPGHAAALEEGARSHMQWYSGAGGAWQWNGFEIIMGERTGQYVWGTFGHQYADWDTPDVDQQASSESIGRNISPHVQDVTVSMVSLRPELSMLVENRPLRPLYEVVTFELNMGMDLKFQNALAMLKEAFETVPDDVEYFVYQAAQGGSGEWVVSIPHDSFGSMGGPDDDGFLAIMRQVHGEHGWDAFQSQFNEAVASASSEVFALRPDLSVNQPPM